MKKIKSLMPADGWFSKALMDEGDTILTRLAGWILTETSQGTPEIEGVDANKEGTVLSESITNFDGYIHKDDPEFKNVVIDEYNNFTLPKKENIVEDDAEDDDFFRY